LPLTTKQKRFAEEYIKDWNATQAAIRAGYSRKTAGIQGFEVLRHPEVKKYINEKLSEFSLSADEVLKAISDIAKSNLNEYFTTRQIVRTAKIVAPLKKLIQGCRDKIEDIDKLIVRMGISGDDLESYNQQKDRLQMQIVEYEIELERNPKASRIVEGEPQLVETVELDLNKLVADKQGGRIKSYSVTEFGPKVELCAPDGALINLAKIHGLFEKDNKQKQPTITPFTDEQVNKLIAAARERKNKAS
jgi:hypothetical protein